MTFCMFSYGTLPQLPLSVARSDPKVKWDSRLWVCEFWGSCSGVMEDWDWGLLGCDIVSRSEWWPMFPREPSPSPSPVQGPWRMPRGVEKWEFIGKVWPSGQTSSEPI